MTIIVYENNMDCVKTRNHKEKKYVVEFIDKRGNVGCW